VLGRGGDLEPVLIIEPRLPRSLRLLILDFRLFLRKRRIKRRREIQKSAFLKNAPRRMNEWIGA
jgi:hypothetical protein